MSQKTKSRRLARESVVTLVVMAFLSAIVACGGEKTSSSSDASAPKGMASQGTAPEMDRDALIGQWSYTVDGQSAGYTFRRDGTAAEDGPLGAIERTWHVKGTSICVKAEEGMKLCFPAKLRGPDSLDLTILGKTVSLKRQGSGTAGE